MKSQDDVKVLFDQLVDLTATQKETIMHRYMFIMNEYVWRCRLYTFLFYLFRLVITVGSLSVPALLSLNSAASAAATNDIYWFTWAVSLSVTTANGLTTLFKLDRRYYMLHATAERLRSETWQYVQLSGRYSGYYGALERPTHANQYVFYCGQLEKLHMKQVNDEYLKNLDMGTAPQQGSQGPQSSPAGPQGAAQFTNTILVPESRDMRKESAPDMFDIPVSTGAATGLTTPVARASGQLPPLHPPRQTRYSTSVAVIYPEPQGDANGEKGFS